MTREERLADLTGRTLVAFALDDGRMIEAVTEEWEGHTLGELFESLMLLTLKMRTMAMLPAGGHAALQVFGPKTIDEAPPGLRCGVRMMTAGMNGDIQTLRDLVSAFIAEVPEEDLQLQASMMYRSVFQMAAGMVHDAYRRSTDPENN